MNQIQHAVLFEIPLEDATETEEEAAFYFTIKGFTDAMGGSGVTIDTVWD